VTKTVGFEMLNEVAVSSFVNKIGYQWRCSDKNCNLCQSDPTEASINRLHVLLRNVSRMSEDI